MKTVLGLIILLMTAGAQAGENVVCSLIKNARRAAYISVVVDLKDLKEYYHPSDSLTVGDNSYSYILEVTREGSMLTLVSTFQDTNDEVGQSVWEVDLSKTKKGKPVVNEPITDTAGENSMTFVCYHNK